MWPDELNERNTRRAEKETELRMGFTIVPSSVSGSKIV